MLQVNLKTKNQSVQGPEDNEIRSYVSSKLSFSFLFSFTGGLPLSNQEYRHFVRFVCWSARGRQLDGVATHSEVQNWEQSSGRGLFENQYFEGKWMLRLSSGRQMAQWRRICLHTSALPSLSAHEPSADHHFAVWAPGVNLWATSKWPGLFHQRLAPARVWLPTRKWSSKNL